MNDDKNLSAAPGVTKRKPKRKPFFVGQRFKAFGRMWTVIATGQCDANDIRITVERTR